MPVSKWWIFPNKNDFVLYTLIIPIDEITIIVLKKTDKEYKITTKVVGFNKILQLKFYIIFWIFYNPFQLLNFYKELLTLSKSFEKIYFIL